MDLGNEGNAIVLMTKGLSDGRVMVVVVVAVEVVVAVAVEVCGSEGVDHRWEGIVSEVLLPRYVPHG